MLVYYDISVCPAEAMFQHNYDRLANRLREEMIFLRSFCAQGIRDSVPAIVAEYHNAVGILDAEFEHNVDVLLQTRAWSIRLERKARKQAKKARKALAAVKKARKALAAVKKARKARKQAKKARKALAAAKKAERISRFNYLAEMKNLRREDYIQKAKAQADREYIMWMGPTQELMESHFARFVSVYMDYEDCA